jgi:hypothetical protein
MGLSAEQFAALQGRGTDTLYEGTNSLTTAAEALAASRSCSEVLVQADPANTTNVLVGNARRRPAQANELTVTPTTATACWPIGAGAGSMPPALPAD